MLFSSGSFKDLFVPICPWHNPRRIL